MAVQDINEITQKIIGCTFEVSITLGIGFVEKVYENALQLSEHIAQALNYLRTIGLELCLLINFGRTKIEIKRFLPPSHWKSAKP